MDMDREYQNGAFIPGADALVEAWARDTAAFRAAHRFEDLAYGPGARQGMDLFWPDGPAKGLMVFIHGGYWMAFGRADWSHLAAGALARGWACALPSYTLAPEGRIAHMTQDMARAVAMAGERVGGPVVVTGHSAGGHLAARLACGDQSVRIDRVVPISPLAELEPLLATEMNQTLQLDADEVAQESPARHRLRQDVQAHVWVGAQERPAFLWQARTLSESWACPWTVDPGKHHFNVVDGLTDSDSALMQALLGGY
ncbi:alpha/beta hydrolase [Neogemmobacter tilapiae]|uniref:Esterase n=1 Tax=Neogemmobacter tilapiae TaxID=875041 RepID=A0A918TQ36_9RHOB|nr:alpha/beta hydrolase [Gemmobacter tilapiae]GHC55946.1 esterase [Gemmobacter tilapiae]